jgi:hypothetical protein
MCTLKKKHTHRERETHTRDEGGYMDGIYLWGYITLHKYIIYKYTLLDTWGITIKVKIS